MHACIAQRYLLVLMHPHELVNEAREHAQVGLRSGRTLSIIRIVDLPVVCLALEHVEQERIVEEKFEAHVGHVEPERLRLEVQFELALRK